MYTDNDILFPRRSIQQLKDVRGDVWQALVERICQLPETHEETLAFMLMMIRLNGCMGCETDSYRAMRGCSACAQQVLRRFNGTDEELLERFHDALTDVRVFVDDQQKFDIIRDPMAESKL